MTILRKRQPYRVSLKVQTHGFNLGLNLEIKFVFPVYDVFHVAAELLLLFREELNLEARVFESRNHLLLFVGIVEFIVFKNQLYGNRDIQIIPNLEIIKKVKFT